MKYAIAIAAFVLFALPVIQQAQGYFAHVAQALQAMGAH
jgi:hypothetical protein